MAPCRTPRGNRSSYQPLNFRSVLDLKTCDMTNSPDRAKTAVERSVFQILSATRAGRI